MVSGANLHAAQLMLLPLTVCCFSKIQIGFIFLILAHLGSPGQRAVKRVCVLLCGLTPTIYTSPFPFTTNTRLTHTRFSGLPRWAGTRKEKNQSGFYWSKRQWHQLGHKQVCISLQTDNHASTPPLSFYRLDALPATQPTASKHWRHIYYRQLQKFW